MLRFWLDRGVDGFRIDVAHYILKDPALRDDPPTGSRPPRPSTAPAHRHDRTSTGCSREMRSLLEEYSPPRVAIGEIHEEDLAVRASYYGDGDELHLPFNFSLLAGAVGGGGGAPPGGGARGGAARRGLAELGPRQSR